MKSVTGKILIQAASLILALSITSMSHAATRCVHPTGAGGCFNTIQGAVDVSNWGDTVALRAGRYHENVVVDVPKLTIVGPREAIVEAGFVYPSADPLDGPAFTIEAYLVKLQGFSIHNGNNYHVKIADGVKQTQIIGMSFRNAEDAAIYGSDDNDKTTIVGSRFHSVDYEAIYLYGDFIRVENNWFSNTDDAAISIDGDRAFVKRNKIFATGDYGIDIDGDYMNVIENETNGTTYEALNLYGDYAYVYKNRIFNSGDYGIEVDGDNARVTGNLTDGTEDSGIDVFGSSPQVKNNTVKGVLDDYGIDVDCDNTGDTCARAAIWYNHVLDSGYDCYGYDIDADLGMSIKNNTAKNIPYDGFNLDIDDVFVSGNRADYVGSSEEPCFEIDGDNNTVTGNHAHWCAGDGFEIDGDYNRFNSNRAVNTAESGFLVDYGSSNNTLYRNVATGNALNGFLVRDGLGSTTNNQLRNNTASGNLYSVCDDGTGTFFSANVFPIAYPGTVNNGDGVQDCPND